MQLKLYQNNKLILYSLIFFEVSIIYSACKSKKNMNKKKFYLLLFNVH